MIVQHPKCNAPSQILKTSSMLSQQRNMPTKVPSTYYINLRCFEAKPFFLQISALFWRTKYGAERRCVCVPDTEAEESRSLSDDHQAGVMGITHARIIIIIIIIIIMVKTMMMLIIMICCVCRCLYKQAVTNCSLSSFCNIFEIFVLNALCCPSEVRPNPIT